METTRLRIFFLLLNCLFCWTLFAQRPQYDIRVTLDTMQNTLAGQATITYTNQSTLPLHRLGIHTWMDAFSTNSSALVKQMLHQGNLKLYRAKPEDRGGYTQLDITSATHQVSFQKDTVYIDIGWINLSQPLQPGQQIILNIAFEEKLPISFSRPGYTGLSYQLTQWYPHIAVFNEEGWHTMPYLDSGEFFNDFADYDVKISAPAGYTIAATGSLVSAEKINLLKEWHFKAENVIDFAWFGSPYFQHQSKKVNVGGSQEVDLNIYIDPFLNEDWDSALVYASRALKFYSDWLGPYPYPQMSVVYAPFSKAGYMEYPMVAQIAYADSPSFLDRVIAHEIGHTWIYAILASDERKSPWIDEGFNTFLEDQYMKLYYGDAREIAFPDIMHHQHAMNHYDALLHAVRNQRKLQSPVTLPDEQSGDQYLFSAYMLPSKGLEIMHQQVGTPMMKKMYQAYFNKHQFTHVSASDIQQTFESTCRCDLNWFFEEYIHHAHEVDYRIKKLDLKDNVVEIKNNAESKLPVLISGYRKEKLVEKKFDPGFIGVKTFTFDQDIDKVILYDSLSSNKKWLLDKRPVSIVPIIHLVPKIGEYTRPGISLTPMFGYNLTDGLMPGLTMMSDILPQPNLKFLLIPMFGVDSKEFRYHGDIRWSSDIDFAGLDKVLMSVSASSFGYNVDTHYLYRDHYDRFSPSIAFRLKENSLYSHTTQWLKYRYVNIHQDYGVGDDFFEYIFHREERRYDVHELSYQRRSDNVLQPYYAQANVQTGDGFVRLNLAYQQHFRGKDKMRGVWIRGFAGWLPYLDQPKANVLLFFNGISSNGYSSKDYMYDEWLIGRNAVNGNFTRQVFMRDAGLKTFATNGISDKWMLGGGISAAMPFKVVHFYIDAALYPSAITDKVTLSYSGGIAVVLMKDAFEIYLPILESKDIRESLPYQINKLWHERITFQASFKLANPFYLVDELQYKYQ